MIISNVRFTLQVASCNCGKFRIACLHIMC